jgi:hypothetical protein
MEMVKILVMVLRVDGDDNKKDYQIAENYPKILP